MRKTIVTTLLTASLIATNYNVALAIDVPNFPSCLSPQGTVRVEYADGTHGIVGSTATYTGSDRVYELSSTTLQQCFCGVDGLGIQTNWWNASSLSEEQVGSLVKEGWFYVPNGSLWGLLADPYLAKNSEYRCLNSPSPTSSSSNSSSSSSSSNSSSSSDQQSGEVLGFAGTGDSLTFISLAVLSILFLGLALRRSHVQK